MIKRFAIWASSLGILCLASSFVAQPSRAQDEAKAEDAILILDASGSMWGQIDGINKIVIAKDVVEELVRSLPDDQRLGLVAYGHRRKGDCADIQTLSDVGGDRDDMIKEIRGLNPKGKTPLSDSVKYAAENLNYTKKAATVILVSDGIETCAPDPCELARLLEENGLDFTVHVVGFDVTVEERESLACIAEETGGEFLSADNAEELGNALTQVAAVSEPAPQPDAEPQEQPQEVALKATMFFNGPDIQSNLNWEVVPADGGDPVFTAEDAGYVDFEVLPGDYVVNVVWTGWPHDGDRYGGDKSGTKTFTVHPQRPAVVTVPIDLGIPVSLEADGEITQGDPINVTWSGPDDLGAYLTSNALDDGPRDQIYFSPAQRARNADDEKTDTNGDGEINQDDLANTQIGGPSIAGNYELRYVLADPRLILARVPVKVNPREITLNSPAEVIATTEFNVTWEGDMTDGDFLTIVPVGSEDVFTNGVTSRVTDGEASTLKAFAEAGEYEVRYIMTNGYTTYEGMQHQVLASAPLTLTDITAELSAADTAVGGSTISVDITPPEGTKWDDDTVSVVEVGATKTNSDARYTLYRIQEDDGRFSVRVPTIEGEYELIYVVNPGSRILTRRPITITRAKASVSAPSSAPAGTPIEVDYSGDAFGGDRILIVPAETPDERMWQWNANYGFGAKAGETSGTINGAYAAKEPGDYEIRYVTGLQHQVLARQPITITD